MGTLLLINSHTHPPTVAAVIRPGQELVVADPHLTLVEDAPPEGCMLKYHGHLRSYPLTPVDGRRRHVALARTAHAGQQALQVVDWSGQPYQDGDSVVLPGLPAQPVVAADLVERRGDPPAVAAYLLKLQGPLDRAVFEGTILTVLAGGVELKEAGPPAAATMTDAAVLGDQAAATESPATPSPPPPPAPPTGPPETPASPAAPPPGASAVEPAAASPPPPPTPAPPDALATPPPPPTPAPAAETPPPSESPPAGFAGLDLGPGNTQTQEPPAGPSGG